MKSVLLALAGAVISVLAFPPYGPGWLIFFGIGLFLIAIRDVETRKQGLLVGSVYGLVFFGGLMWWLAELELIALILVPLQAAFLAAYAWWLARYNQRPAGVWLTLAVGGWGVMELIRYHYPVGGLEWGAAGYALSDNWLTRAPAAVFGTSGLTLAVVAIGAVIALAIVGRFNRAGVWGIGVIGLFVLTSFVPLIGREYVSFGSLTATIAQGSTPCPFSHCSPNERLGTYEQHLALTETIPVGSSDLVVWSEGSTGSSNADPLQNPEIGLAIGEQARRIGARFLVGSDRPVSDGEWVNVNVFFDSQGQIVGEYRKRHPVPFGEYIPFRPLFDWIPALDRVPRDMIPGDGPLVIDGLGSVISFEGGFSRYALDTRRAGADVIVVATNEASYGPNAPTSDQFIGMTRMRAVELGVPVVHAAVTGKSTIIDERGYLGSRSSLGSVQLINGPIAASYQTPYTTIGNSVMYLAAVLGLLTWWRSRSLVGSNAPTLEEE